MIGQIGGRIFLPTEMGKWGMCWARDAMTEKQNTASGLLRDLAGRIDIDQLPSGNTSIELTLTDIDPAPAGYIHVRDGKTQVCDTDLGFEVDVYITSALDVMTRVWYGQTEMNAAVESGKMRVSAAPVYTRHLTRWLRVSSFTTDDPSLGTAPTEAP